MLFSVRTKIVALVFSSVLIVATALLYLSTQQHEKFYQQTIIANLKATTANLADDLVPFLSAKPVDDIDLLTALLRLERFEYIVYAAIIDADGNLISQYNNEGYINSPIASQIAAKPISFVTLGITESTLTVGNTIGDSVVGLGHLVVIQDYATPLAQATKQFVSGFGAIIVAILFFAFIFTHRIQRQITRPLMRLTEITQKIQSSQDYSLRSHIDSNDEVGTLSRSFDNMLDTIVKQNLAKEKAKLKLNMQQAELEQLANYDQLTGAPNRKLYLELLDNELNYTKRSQDKLAVMFLDLDNFKVVNDSLGHHIGDQFLTAVYYRLKSLLRSCDTVARLGGDEFIITLSLIKSPQDAILVARKIVKSFDQSFPVESWKINSSTSIGIAFFPEHGEDSNTLMKNADAAMYQAKKSGRGAYTVFHDALAKDNMRKVELANAIQEALETEQFQVYFQPKVSPERQVKGFEVLLRWIRPNEGFISPDEFIPLAESSGRITEITRWVIQTSLMRLPQLQSKFGNDIKLSINLSPIDLQNEEFIQYLKEKVITCDVESCNIEFEITESTFLDDVESAVNTLNSIKSTGCILSLDDFGKGYSSLSYLRRLPVDIVKIDKEFVNCILEEGDDQAVVMSVLDLATRLGLKVCAEGVETEEQYQFLADRGCDLFQGYFFGKPLSLDETISHLDLYPTIEKEDLVIH